MLSNDFQGARKSNIKEKIQIFSLQVTQPCLLLGTLSDCNTSDLSNQMCCSTRQKREGDIVYSSLYVSGKTQDIRGQSYSGQPW